MPRQHGGELGSGGICGAERGKSGRLGKQVTTSEET